MMLADKLFQIIVLTALSVEMVSSVSDTRSSVQSHIGCLLDDSYERCFTLFTMPRTWEDAESICQQQQQQQNNTSRLVVIDSENIEDMIGAELKDMNSILDNDDGYGAWTGGRKLGDPTWKWTGQQPFTVDQWPDLAVNFSAQLNEFQTCAELSIDPVTSSVHLASRMCRALLPYFMCRQNDTAAEDQNSTETSPLSVDCHINGTLGVRLPRDLHCYAMFHGTVLPPSIDQLPSGVLSWFKANYYCQRVGAELASFDQSMSGTSTTALVNYVSTVTPGASIWIGLQSYPWVWVNQYNLVMHSVVSTSPMYYSAWLEPFEPNKEVQDCIMVSYNDERHGWENERCENRKPFICETINLARTTTPKPTTIIGLSIVPMMLAVETVNTTDENGNVTQLEYIASDNDNSTSVDTFSQFFERNKTIIGIVVPSLVSAVLIITAIAAGIACCQLNRRGSYTLFP